MDGTGVHDSRTEYSLSIETDVKDNDNYIRRRYTTITPKVVGFLCFVWIIGMILGSVNDFRTDLCETDTAGVTHCYDTTAKYLASLDNVFVQTSILGINIPVPNTDYIKTLAQVATMQFSFIQGQWQIVWAIVMLPLCAMAIFGLLTWALQIFQGFLPF